MPATSGATGPSVRTLDALAGLQWAAIIIPPSLGMWVFGTGLVGLPAPALGVVLTGAFFALGVSTLLQLWVGWHVPVFEAPASVHLAMVVAVAAATTTGVARIEEVAGGIIVAGVTVMLIGVSRLDRLLRQMFTPAVTAAFILALSLVLLPDALSQAIARSPAEPWGTWDGWLLLGLALVAGGLAYMHRSARPFALLVALAAAIAVRWLIGWPSATALRGGWTLPEPFWWGAPRFRLEVVLPFVLVGLVGAFNILGSLSAMSAVIGPGHDRPRRGLVVNGAVQIVQSAFVGFIGTVGHLESASVVRMLGRDGRRSLAIAAFALIALSFVDPLVRAIATIPLQVSAVLLLVLLLALSLVAIEIVRSISRRVALLVILPALLGPTWWLIARPSGAGIAVLLNPVVLAVLVAVIAQRLVGRGTPRDDAGPVHDTDGVAGPEQTPQEVAT